MVWVPMAMTLSRSSPSSVCQRELPLRFVFPHAPMRPVTINGGMSMRAWYDIVSLDAEGRADAAGVHESTALLEGLIARETERGIPAEKIVIAGFSMGGAVAINTALHSSKKLAGLMALSTYLPLPSEVEGSTGSRDLPVFMAHGSFDPMLPMQWGQVSAERLQDAGFHQSSGMTTRWHMQSAPKRFATSPRGWSESTDLKSQAESRRRRHRLSQRG